MTIIILTDSLGLPRLVPEAVPLEKTYIEKLKLKYKELNFITLNIGGATLPMLRNQYFNYFSPVNPDLVLIHAGIVDCAPRALKTWEIGLMERLPPLKFLFNLFFRKKVSYLRKVRKLTYTKLFIFRNIVEEFRRSLGEKVYWAGIIPATNAYEASVPGISKNIDSYNKIISGILSDNFIDTSDMPQEGIMSDHHHINEIGHNYIFSKFSAVIEKTLLHVE